MAFPGRTTPAVFSDECLIGQRLCLIVRSRPSKQNLRNGPTEKGKKPFFHVTGEKLIKMTRLVHYKGHTSTVGKKH